MLSPSFFFGFQWMAAHSTSSFSWQLSRETEGTQTRGHSCIGWDLTVEVFRWATCASLHFYSCLISLTSYRVSDSIKYSRIELLLCGTVSLLDLRNYKHSLSMAKKIEGQAKNGKCGRWEKHRTWYDLNRGRGTCYPILLLAFISPSSYVNIINEQCMEG